MGWKRSTNVNNVVNLHLNFNIATQKLMREMSLIGFYLKLKLIITVINIYKENYIVYQCLFCFSLMTTMQSNAMKCKRKAYQ